VYTKRFLLSKAKREMSSGHNFCRLDHIFISSQGPLARLWVVGALIQLTALYDGFDAGRHSRRVGGGSLCKGNLTIKAKGLILARENQS
jgi:hypothetical protein